MTQPKSPLPLCLGLLIGCDHAVGPKLVDDTGCASDDQRDWYLDADRDGYGDASQVLTACEAPEAYVDNADDCDDHDASIFAITEYYVDADRDGFGAEERISSCGQPEAASEQSGDCDDSDSAVSPDAEPDCGDLVDNNCDGLSDCDTPTGALSTGNADATFYGSESSAFGSAVAGLGDLDGDGILDLGFGAPAEVEGGGAAYTYLSPTSGVQETSDAASRLYDSESFTDAVGTYLMGADMNGDGIQDIIVTETGSNSQFIAYGPIGQSQALSNGDGVALLRWSGCGGYAHSVDVGEDLLDQDGQRELVVGCPGYDTGGADGAVAIVGGPIQSGSTSTHSVTDRLVDLLVLSEDGNNGQLGSFVSRAGDLDGDGVADLAAQAIWYTEGDGEWPGRVFVFTGLEAYSDDVVAEDVALTSLVGPEHRGGFGSAIAPAGDVDGDGLDDLLVGQSSYSPTGDDVGLALVFTGDTLSRLDQGSVVEALKHYDTRITGTSAGEEAGAALAGLGDVNGDQIADIAVGSPGVDSDRGGAFVWFSPLPATATLDEADLCVLGESADDRLGASLAGPGDVNALGYGDLLVGAPGVDEGAGRAWLFHMDSL